MIGQTSPTRSDWFDGDHRMASFRQAGCSLHISINQQIEFLLARNDCTLENSSSDLGAHWKTAPPSPQRLRLNLPFDRRIEGNLDRVVFVAGQELRSEFLFQSSLLSPLPLGERQGEGLATRVPKFFLFIEVTGVG